MWDQLTVGRRVDSSNMLFRRIAGVSAILAVLIGGLSGVLFLAAGGFRLDSAGSGASARGRIL